MLLVISVDHRNHWWTVEITCEPSWSLVAIVITGGPSWSLVDHRDHWWTIVITGGPSWSLVDHRDLWWPLWSLVDHRDHWWTIVITGGPSWSLVDHRDHWWTIVITGGPSWSLLMLPGALDKLSATCLCTDTHHLKLTLTSNFFAQIQQITLYRLIYLLCFKSSKHIYNTALFATWVLRCSRKLNIYNQ